MLTISFGFFEQLAPDTEGFASRADFYLNEGFIVLEYKGSAGGRRK